MTSGMDAAQCPFLSLTGCLPASLVLWGGPRGGTQESIILLSRKPCPSGRGASLCLGHHSKPASSSENPPTPVYRRMSHEGRKGAGRPPAFLALCCRLPISTFDLSWPYHQRTFTRGSVYDKTSDIVPDQGGEDEKNGACGSFFYGHRKHDRRGGVCHANFVLQSIRAIHASPGPQAVCRVISDGPEPIPGVSHL